MQNLNYVRLRDVQKKHFGHLFPNDEDPLPKESSAEDVKFRTCLDNLNNILIPGYETLSRAVTCLLLELTHRQDVLEKLMEDLKDFHSNPTMENLQKCEYLEWTWKETLRRYPPNPNIYRVTAEDTDKYQRGSILTVAVEIMHHDEEVWDNPYEFRPERWRDPSSINTSYFMPFSVGSSSCVANNFTGLLAKVLIATLLRYLVFSYDGSIPKMNYDDIRGPFGQVLFDIKINNAAMSGAS